MAVTMAPSSGTGPGNASSRGFYAISGRALTAYPFTLTFDTSYPTSGESIAATIANSPYAAMGTVQFIDCVPFVAPGGTGGSTAGHVMTGAADLVNKKVILVDNGTEASNAGNYSLITMSCIAYGY